MLIIDDYFKVINVTSENEDTNHNNKSKRIRQYIYMEVRCMPNLTNKGEAGDDNFILLPK